MGWEVLYNFGYLFIVLVGNGDYVDSVVCSGIIVFGCVWIVVGVFFVWEDVWYIIDDDNDFVFDVDVCIVVMIVICCWNVIVDEDEWCSDFRF